MKVCRGVFQSNIITDRAFEEGQAMELDGEMSDGI